MRNKINKNTNNKKKVVVGAYCSRKQSWVI